MQNGKKTTQHMYDLLQNQHKEVNEISIAILGMLSIERPPCPFPPRVALPHTTTLLPFILLHYNKKKKWKAMLSIAPKVEALIVVATIVP